MEPVVVSFQTEIDVETHAHEEPEEALSRYLSSVVSALQTAECPLIGHIKAMITDKGDGFLLANATSFDEPPTITGKLENTGGASLTVHAVVYGVENSLLDEILRKPLLDHFS